MYLSHLWSSMSVAFLYVPTVLFIVNDVWLSTHPWRDPFFTVVDLLTLFYTRMLDSESLLNSTFGQTWTHAHPAEHSTSCKGINDKCEIPPHSGVFWCFSVLSHCFEFCPLGSVVAWVTAEDRAQLGLIISSVFRQLHMSTSVGSFVLFHLQSGCHVPWEGSKFFVIGSVQWNLPPQKYRFLSFVLHCFSSIRSALCFPLFCIQYRIVLCLSELPRVCIWILQVRLHNNKSIQLDIRFNYVNHMI